MIKYVDGDKNVKIPRNLGNMNQTVVEGGISREEAQALIDASLDDYTLTEDFATINGKPITEGGNIQITGGTPTEVTVTQVVTAGTKIATVSVDGTATDLYAPAGSGGGVTPQEVQDAIDQALQDYPTTAVTQDLDERVTELESEAVGYATTADTQALETAISGKSTVVWNQITTAGTKVAEITVNGTSTDVYAPTSGGGGVTPQDVQNAIDSALTGYSTTQQVETMLDGKQDVLSPGTGIEISGDTISCTVTGYTLPVASNQVLGGVKVGTGLAIDSSGVLSATGGGGAGITIYDTDEIRAMTSEERSAVEAELASKVSAGDSDYLVIGHHTVNGFPVSFPCTVQNIEGIVSVSAVYINYMGGRRIWTYTLANNHASDGDLIEFPFTRCVYVGPNGDFWAHRSAEELYDEGAQQYLSVKGCLIDFSEVYGFGSVVYARQWTENGTTYYRFCLIVPTPTGTMRGVWETTDINDTSTYTLKYWQPEYNVWTGSQAEYNAIGAGNYDSDTIYYIDRS